MLDIGWTELLVIAVVLIVVVGPKDLPPMLRAFGKMTANLRKMAGEFRTQFDEALRESELGDVRKTTSDAQRLNPTNALRDAINPLRQMGEEIKADLQKATKAPSNPEAVTTDIEAQQAIEGVTSSETRQDGPVELPQPAVTLPSSPPTIPAAPAQSDPAGATPAPATSGAQAAGANSAIAEKPKPARKATARMKSAADAVEPQIAAAEKPKRSRAVKPAQTAEETAAKAPARKRAAKKAETPEGEA